MDDWGEWSWEDDGRVASLVKSYVTAIVCTTSNVTLRNLIRTPPKKENQAKRKFVFVEPFLIFYRRAHAVPKQHRHPLLKNHMSELVQIKQKHAKEQERLFKTLQGEIQKVNFVTRCKFL